VKKITYLLFIIILMFTTISGNAQDKIFIKTGSNMEVKILEININDVKYKKYDNLEGPIYTIDKNKINMIIYENGTKDMFGGEANVNKNISKQSQSGLISGSKLYLTYVNTAFKKNVDGANAEIMLNSYLEKKTTCIVVDTRDDADFIVELKVIKEGGRKAKIDIIHVLSDKKIFESKWRKGTNAIHNGMSGSKQAIGEIVKISLLDKYPEIRK